MVSLKDIAKTCGVSTATVSKALNGHKDIGDETRAKIHQTAKEMGYIPNAAAKSLKTKHTKNIGVLFADEAQSGLTHDFFSNVLDSFKREVERQGYDLTFINSSKDRPNRMTYLEHSRYRRFDGVVIAVIDFDDPEVKELVSSDIPIVTIDHSFNNKTAVVSDNVAGMKELLTYIYSKGHRKIAYIHGADSAVTKQRLSSFFKTAEELGIEVPDEYIREAAYRSTKGAYSQTKELLELPDPPTCILYPDDFATFGGIAAIDDKGLTIPEDISVAGYDGIRISRHMTPMLATYKQNPQEMGRKAAVALVSMIEKPKTTVIEQITVRGEVFEGATVRQLG